MENHESLNPPSRNWIVIKDPDTPGQMYWKKMKNRGGIWTADILASTKYANRAAVVHVWVYARRRFPLVYHMSVGVIDDFQ